MLYKRRKHFDSLGKKIGAAFSKLPMSPNQWTCLSLILTLVTLYFFTSHNFIPAAFVFALTAFIDMIDGSVARAAKKVTKFGGYLDSVSDRVIEFLIILGFFSINYPIFILPSSLWLLFLFFGAFMSTYARAAAFEKQVYKDLRGGLLEHTDRLLAYLLVIAVSAFSFVYASYLIALVSILSNISALQRFIKVVKNNR